MTSRENDSRLYVNNKFWHAAKMMQGRIKEYRRGKIRGTGRGNNVPGLDGGKQAAKYVAFRHPRNATAVRRTAVRETGVSQYHGRPIEGSPETHRTSTALLN